MMECHDVRSLLTFAQRDCEQLDAAEREALQFHLDRCPDCIALTQAERRLDKTLGQIMRNVPVPADLRTSVLKRLAGERRPAGWRRTGLATAAAAALLLAIGAGVWYVKARPEVTGAEVAELAARDIKVAAIRNAEDADKYLADEGVFVLSPRDLFDYQYLQRVEIVEFKKRRVAKFLFRNEHARADVIILPHDQFRTDMLADHQDLTVRIQREPDFTYLIFHSGGVDSLRAIRA